MKSSERALRKTLSIVFVIGLPIVALASACTSEQTTTNPAPQQGTPATPVVQGTRADDTTTQAPSLGTKCEELGTLTGTSLRALLGEGMQSVTFPLVDRPLPSRLAVVAVGSASDLTGKTVALGAAENANYKTCSRCLVVAIGCSTPDCAQAAWFFPRSGTATLTSVATKSGQDFDGTFTDVVLEEVKIDLATTRSTPVVGGACLHIQSLTFESSATTTSEPTDAGSTSSSGTSGSSGGELDAGAVDSGTGTSSGTGGGGGGSGQKAFPFTEF